MAQPAVDQNAEQARKANLESERARSRTQAAQKARRRFGIIEGGRSNTVDPQRLQAVSGGGGNRRESGQSTDPRAEEQAQYAQQRLQETQAAPGAESAQARQAQLLEQQSIAQTLETVSSSLNAAQQSGAQEQDEDIQRLERIIDLFTGTSGPTVGSIDAASGLSSFIITVFYWAVVVTWWDIKWLFGGKLIGGLGRLITPLSWGSILSALKLSPEMEKVVNEMGKTELWAFMTGLNIAIVLVMFMYTAVALTLIILVLAPFAYMFG
jgi:hypothetical protein